MTAVPSGGVGSNQYVSKGAPTRRRTRAADPGVAQVAAVVADPEAEAVAWALDPRHDWWRKAGVTSKEEADAWRDTNLPGGDIKSWVETEFTPAEAKRWWDAGFGRLANVWVADAHKWRDAGFDPDTAIQWVAACIGPYAAEAHRDASESIEEAVRRWDEAGFNADARGLWSSDVGPLEDAIAWRDIGCPIYLAGTWIQHGYTPATAKPWIDQGVNDAAKAWKADHPKRDRR